MRSFRPSAAILGAIFVLAGCTQQQQSTISSSEWQRNLNNTVDDLAQTAQAKLEHTGNWLTTETEFTNLQAVTNRAIENGSVTKNQATSLRNSLDYIRTLQNRSISSGDGISTSEKAQIVAAIDRVEQRLDGWIAAGRQENM